MSKGFIFNHGKCVACNACCAACVIENGWTVQPRRVYTYNDEALPMLTLYNLSMSCNHCESAVCLDGCPTASFSRDLLTGAVIIDESTCIGCRYCKWNCPYDAPKPEIQKGTMNKCNLCNQGFIEGRLPACSTACPTGALEYGDMPDIVAGKTPEWFPMKNLNPAFRFAGESISALPRIIPEKLFGQAIHAPRLTLKNISSEWSLIAFSFLTMLSVSTLIITFIRGVNPDKFILFSMLILALISSLLHLGRPSGAFRALLNIRKSPLSLEIVLYILFSGLALISVLFSLPGVLIAASAAGLALLISIDRVYTFADKRVSVYLHSGQTFLSALLVISFFTGNILAFIFIGSLRLISAVYFLTTNSRSGIYFGLRFFRISLLLITAASLISGISDHENLTILLFLAGELLDRIFFYFDFNPLNINTLIDFHINSAKDEKKRG